MKGKPTACAWSGGVTLIWLALGAPALLAQPSLSDFGYQHRAINGELPIGPRPLLVMIAEFQGQAAMRHTAAYYDSLIFPFAAPSINGYFLENSTNRFFWSRTSLGVVGPVSFTSQENDSNALDNPKGISYIFRQIVQRQGLDLSGFDDNGDHKITEEELGLLIITNQGDGYGGAARRIDPSGCVQPLGSSVQVCGGDSRITILGDGVSFGTFCHELAHQLGTKDLYGPSCLSRYLTLMSCTRESFGEIPDQMLFYHLDPWHKLQLGWIEPRIRSLKAGGIESLPAVQMLQTDGPVILYDPARGAGEFFIIEYRTRTSPNGAGYDANTSGWGMAIWHIQQDANKEPIQITPGVWTVFHEGFATLAQGGSALWPGGNTTPLLQWNDGTQMTTNIVIHPFTIGDGSITVEWLTDDEVWLDFNYVGTELGTFNAPYRTLATGLAGTPRGGRLRIKAGATSETAQIVKPMRVNTYGGAAVLGQ